MRTVPASLAEYAVREFRALDTRKVRGRVRLTVTVRLSRFMLMGAGVA